MKIKVIVTGATGMVGEGVLNECLIHPDVEQVLVINRHSCEVSHPKLKEIIHNDFFNLSDIESQLSGYDACFFCLGVSSVGMNYKDYFHLTYELTMNVAKTVSGKNPESVFCYVSGAGTDNSEKGRSMWARVKGKTENDIAKLPFKSSYMFRPGGIKPTKGMKHTLKIYAYFGWLYPIMKTFFPGTVCELREIGLAMINSVTKGYGKKVLEVKDIIELAKR